MSKISLKHSSLRGRQNVYGYILVGFSFLILTFLTVKTLAPEIKTDAAQQTASQTVGPYTMSMSNDSVATINITPTDTQTVYTGTNNLSVTNTCTAGATITMTTTSTTSNSLTRAAVNSDTLKKDIVATTTTGLDNHSWGYALNNSSTYYAVPKKGTTAATIYNASAAQTSALTVPVKFGVKTNNELPSGTYTNDVIYTMTPKAGCLTYAVTWDFDGGTAKSGATYPTSLSWGATVNLSTLTPTRDGYTFAGWTNGSSNYTGSETAANLNPNQVNPLTLTAQWNPGIYTITLNNQSATSAGTTTIYEKYNTGWYSNSGATTSITTITKPTRTGYKFKGYYTSTGCSGTQRIDANGKITAGNTTYTGNGTLYACWEEEVTTMQSFSCSSLAVDSTTTLTDSRDNNTYTVFRATGANGLCWMSQNLRLINKTITNSDSNISASSWTVPASRTATWGADSSSTDSYTNAYTYDTGNADYGVYYNYMAATAGTISGTSNSTDATYDVCPKGWRLPTQTEWANMFSAYGIANNASGSTIARSAPINLVYSGFHSYYGTNVYYQGSNGYWWSSTANNATSRYNTYINSSNAYPADYNARRLGFSVRCVSAP